MRTFSNENENQLIPEGTYVCKVKFVKKKYKGDTKLGLNSIFEVDTSIEGQEELGTTVYDLLHEDSTSTPNDWYPNASKFEKLVTTLFLPSSYKTNSRTGNKKPVWNIENVDQVIQKMNGKKLKVTITKEYDDYHGEDVNRIKYLSYDKYQEPTETIEDKLETNVASTVSDEDLPF